MTPDVLYNTLEALLETLDKHDSSPIRGFAIAIVKDQVGMTGHECEPGHHVFLIGEAEALKTRVALDRNGGIERLS